MLDIFLIVNVILIIFTAILFYKNRIWKDKPIFVALFVAIVICFLVILLI